MTTLLDIYAATRNTQATMPADARQAARRMNTENGIAALITSVFANVR